MVDLQAQVHELQTEFHEAVEQVLGSGAYIRGPFVQQFEEELAEYLGGQFAIGVGNGTDALQIAYMALGVGPGDEIITPSFTFIATAEAAAVLGARPVFVDIDRKTYNLDPSKLEEAITERTKAIVPVHLFGQSADMDAIREIAGRHGIPVVEDAAQAIGAKYGGGTCGYIGEVGCLSFYPSKNLGAFGDGGAILTNDPDLAERARMISNHGGRKKYRNEVVGINSRLDALHAALLSVKLRHLDRWTAARQNAADLYDQRLADLPVVLPFRSPGGSHVFHQYTIRVPAARRDALQDHLSGIGIPTMVYYPVPLHRLPVFQDLAYDDGALPESESAANEVISMPMHPHLGEDQIDWVADAVRTFLSDVEPASHG